MIRPAPDQVKTIACVGTGTIGGGWVAYYLARGFDVVATDPGDQAEQRLGRVLHGAWPILQEMGLAEGASRDRLRFTTNFEEAVAEADFIQESAPENEALKIELIGRISKTAQSEVVIASSSSAFLPSSLSKHCEHPQRCIVGHPFAPTYVLPLVEVVGGADTDPAVLQWAVEFYNGIGKKALLLKKEIDAYIANRLQSVVLTEATALVDAGVCDYDDIDFAMTYGPGMRWAFAGPAICYYLGGGKGGLEGVIKHFGFKGGEAAKQNLFDSVERMTAGRDIDAMEAWRDRNLLSVLKYLEQVDL